MPSKSLTFQFLVLAFMSLSLILVLQLHPQFRRMSWINGFLALSLGEKSARVTASPSARVHGHVSSWTPAAYGETIGSVEWVQITEGGKTHYWNRCSNETFWNPPEGIKVLWVGEKSAEGRDLVVAQGNSCQCLGPPTSSSWLVGLGAPHHIMGATHVVDKGCRLRSSSTAAVVCTCWFAGPMHLVLCFLLVSSGSRCSVSLPVWTRLSAINSSGTCSACIVGCFGMGPYCDSVALASLSLLRCFFFENKCRFQASM